MDVDDEGGKKGEVKVFKARDIATVIVLLAYKAIIYWFDTTLVCVLCQVMQ